MKTNQLLTILLSAGGIFTFNAQNVANTSNLTSGGLSAGTTGSSAVYYGYEAGKVATGTGNSFIGHQAGKSTTFGANNFFGGFNAGLANTSGGLNTFLGHIAGSKNISGGSNVFIGGFSGNNNTTGSGNVAVGNNAGNSNSSGSLNTYVGNGAGSGTTLNGSNNVYIGNQTGYNSNGSRNVFIGNGVGHSVVGNDLLLIDNLNSSSTAPLIWGDFANELLKFNAKIGIGNIPTFPATAGGVDLSTYKLFVKGGIIAEEIRVTTTWADYVFESNYALPTLDDVECFIAENGHLPNVPSAKQVETEGIEMGEIAKIQQEKIEELTLYIIEQNKVNEKQAQEIKEMKEFMMNLAAKK